MSLLKLSLRVCAENLNVTLLSLKWSFGLVVSYQSAVVFAVLVGQVSNGGRNARPEELLPLVKIALMDFI